MSMTFNGDTTEVWMLLASVEQGDAWNRFAKPKLAGPPPML